MEVGQQWSESNVVATNCLTAREWVPEQNNKQSNHSGRESRLDAADKLRADMGSGRRQQAILNVSCNRKQEKNCENKKRSRERAVANDQHRQQGGKLLTLYFE